MPKMTINPKFTLGQIVYLITDSEQFERIVTGLTITSSGIYYLLRHSDEEITEHNVLEIEEIKKEVKEEEDLEL
jgi:hypothetical protein